MPPKRGRPPSRGGSSARDRPPRPVSGASVVSGDQAVSPVSSEDPAGIVSCPSCGFVPHAGEMLHDHAAGVTLYYGRHLDLRAEANSALFFIAEVAELHTETLMALAVGTAHKLSHRLAGLDFKYRRGDGSDRARLRSLKADAHVMKDTRQILKETVSSLLAIEHEICERTSKYVTSYEELRSQLSPSSSSNDSESLESDSDVTPAPSRKPRRDV
jgi:hypothetical protein